MLGLCCVDVSRVPREIVWAHVALAAERESTASAHRAFSEAARSLMGHLLFRKTLRNALRAPGPPTLIVHGQRDRLVDVRSSRAAAAANPRIELTELPDLGHTPQLESPDTFLEIASRWLDRANQPNTAALRSRLSFGQTSELL
jgi:pimeloyl-ACP methyl ester carboxylesterase